MIQQTSLQAFFDVRKALNERQREVLVAIADYEAATNSMIAKYCKLPINCITPRTNELVKRGVVVQSHKAMCPITKRKAIYWKCKGVYDNEKSNI